MTLPCPAPKAAGPQPNAAGDSERCYDPGDLADTGAATAMTLFHPSKNQTVLVVVAADVAAVEAAHASAACGTGWRSRT